MKIILLNAPGGSHYDGPMMGTPALVGQLKAEGYPETTQRDLDLDLYYQCLEPDFQKEVRAIVSRDFSMGAKGLGFIKKLFVLLFGTLFLRIAASRAMREKGYLDRFRADTPLDAHFPEEGLFRYKKALYGVLKMMAIYLYPYQAYPRFLSQTEKERFHKLHLSAANTIARACAHGKKALIAFYEKSVIPELEEGAFDVIGISVSYKRQLEPGLILAEVIRKHGLDAKIVLGGSFITTTVDSGFVDEAFMKDADYLLTYEGEEAFPLLLKSMQSGQGIDDVPNLVRLKDGEIVRNKRTTIKDINVIATPDYEGLPLDRYLERPIRLHLMTCRGCYWGKCSFCSHHWTLGSGRLRTRTPDNLVNDIESLGKRFGTRSIYFTDESMHPETITKVAKKLIDRDMGIQWMGSLRFDECVDYDFLKTLRDSGCHAIMFGLESLSEHVQKIINKGIFIDRAYQVMEDCRRLGIKVHVFIMLGIPGEREEDVQANIDFLLHHTELYETMQLAFFQLMVGSPMHRHPDRYGITQIETKAKSSGKAYSELSFVTGHGMTRERANERFIELTRNKVIFEKDLWEGYGYRLYLPAKD